MRHIQSDPAKQPLGKAVLVANPDHELLLRWIESPAGFDGFFRETCNLQLTREQINDIARKYG